MRAERSLASAVLFVATQVGFCTLALADVAVHPPFDSHMVLQQGMANPVWGTARSGESVTVTIGEQLQAATTSPEGEWRVMLEPMEAGGPLTMTIEGDNAITLSDVYVGEVWQAAGQSNMDTRLSYYSNLASEISAANLPLMRYFTVRQPGNPPTTWEVVSPSTAGDLSALAYFFGKEIHARTGVAVGLVVTAVGGTSVASWLDPATLAQTPDITNDDRGSMWNEWVSPVVGYGIRGTIWIQGEQNCNSTDSPSYGNVFRLLIDGWRAAWGQGDFPFYYGQLSSIHSLQTDPNNTSDVARVREGQRMALVKPNTAMSVNMDIGSADDWHFPNKPEAGRRLSLPARALVYGEADLPYSGPLYLSKTVAGSEVTLHFDHIGGGLVARDGGELTGFAIAGATGDWVWGTAEIRGDVLVVSSPSVPNPTRVRYAWGDNPILSLFNAEGLPAAAFTTESEDLPPSSAGGDGGAGGTTDAGGASAGGASATGGSTGAGGSPVTGGAPALAGTNAGGEASGGASSMGGSGTGSIPAAGGALATGGMTSAGGSGSGNPPATGGATVGLGGATASWPAAAGGSRAGGAPSIGGASPTASGSGGNLQGNVPPGIGGEYSTGGATSTAPVGGGTGLGEVPGATSPSDASQAGTSTSPNGASAGSDDGCGCRLATHRTRPASGLGALLAVGLGMRFRRRRGYN